MRITLIQFVSLDGVSQGPGSPAEDTSGGFTGGGWLVPHLDELFVRRTADWLGRAGGLLLGRRTYEAFARDWLGRGGNCRSTAAPDSAAPCCRPASSTRCAWSSPPPWSVPGGGCSTTRAHPSAWASPATR